MRRLARALGVEAMSLYKHVSNKDDVLDGLVDLVLGQIATPPSGTEWRTAMRNRARSARLVFARHPWAAALFESRLQHQTPVRLAYADRVIGLLRDGGFDVATAYRAFILLDSYLYGFVLQESSWRVDGEDVSRAARETPQQMSPEAYPHLVEVMAHVTAGGAESPVLLSDVFDHGLQVILDGLERLLREARG